MIFRIIVTVVFGYAWWWCFNYVAPGLTYLMILGSVLAVCACCCQGGRTEWPTEFNYQGWFVCIRRCWPATVTLMIGLIILGVIVVLLMGGGITGTLVTHILVAGIGAPLFVRLICCAYDS
jgi:hypothetical protein